MQQHGKANIFSTAPPPPSPWGKGQTIIFTWFCCISNCRGSQMQQHGSKYFPSNPPPSDLWVGSIGLNSTFSKHSHVAYQIKGIHQCSNMVANILPADPHPPWTLETGSKGQWKLGSEHDLVANQIKANQICRNMVANILTAAIPPPPRLAMGWGQ